MKRKILVSAVRALVIALSFAVSCGKKDDAVSEAEKTEKDRPSIAGTKAIAEEGFIYGLPIVMNYAAMCVYAVDATPASSKHPSIRSSTGKDVNGWRVAAAFAATASSTRAIGCCALPPQRQASTAMTQLKLCNR